MVIRSGCFIQSSKCKHDVRHKSNMGLLAQFKESTVQSIIGHVSDAIEELKLDLELEGRSDIGSVYQPGDVYDFFL